ncbi:MAG: PaaI family thioesterase [Bryobacteraceae bacterium]|nr:PaaI family thioesterase [Bryobacteraceae bacterium]
MLTRAELQTFVDTLPFNSLIGVRVTGVYRDGVRLECQLREELKNALGTMHGGVYASLADAAVGMSLVTHFEFKRKVTTVEMKLNYFLPITEGKLIARGKLLRVGGSLAVGSVEMFNSQRQLAGAALITYKLL